MARGAFILAIQIEHTMYDVELISLAAPGTQHARRSVFVNELA
jgi:hypothetical protein